MEKIEFCKNLLDSYNFIDDPYVESWFTVEFTGKIKRQFYENLIELCNNTCALIKINKVFLYEHRQIFVAIAYVTDRSVNIKNDTVYISTPIKILEQNMHYFGRRGNTYDDVFHTYYYGQYDSPEYDCIKYRPDDHDHDHDYGYGYTHDLF